MVKSVDMKNELIRFLREQIEIENKIVSSLNASLDEIKNPSVKGVLRGEYRWIPLNTLRCIPQPYRSSPEWDKHLKRNI